MKQVQIDKEEKFNKLKKKLKIYDTIDAYSALYPILSGMLISGLGLIAGFASVPLLIVSAVFTLDGVLSLFKKGLTSFLTNKKYEKIENEYYQLGEDLAYFIKDNDGMYYNREYLERKVENKADKKYVVLLNRLIAKQQNLDPVQDMIYEMNKQNKENKNYAYSISPKSKTMFEVKTKEEIKQEKLNKKTFSQQEIDYIKAVEETKDMEQ